MKPMRLEDILFSQGFGTRRVCAGLVQQGYVSVHGEVQDDPGVFFDPEHLKFKVQGTEWPYFDRAYLMLHKPTGTECSQKPSTWPSIYTLLPSPLRLRPQKASVVDTSKSRKGLIKFTHSRLFEVINFIVSFIVCP